MAAAPRPPAPGIKLAIDYGPLLVFFLANSFGARLQPVLAHFGMAADTKPILIATGAFMAATLLAVVASSLRLGRVSPMLWVTAGVVAVFGAATLYFHDETFIKVKPTILYLCFAAVLLFGLVTRRPLLKLLLGEAFPALDEHGWRKLTRNWVIFFVALALLNEVLRRTLTTDQWVAFKVWGILALTMVFALLQTPILTRHGSED